MKFIHCADLHIDSPLKGLESYEGAPVERIRLATREAWDNLTTFALDREVDFLLIAGDVFDGSWRDMSTGLWMCNQLRRLEEARIPVIMLRGNHDAASKLRTTLRWPANVHSFDHKRATTFTLEDLNVAIHGQSFAREEVLEDLAAHYPAALPGHFNIGLLHTSLTGAEGHDSYAPTSLNVLLSKEYDYWALGHIHQRSDPPIHNAPYIAYSGNLQGRHVRETGAKGCLLVEVEDDQIQQVTFHVMDVVRWAVLTLDATGLDDRGELYGKLHQQLEELVRDAGDRLLAVRVQVVGACGLHHQLCQPAQQEEWASEFRNIANEFAGEVWLERIQWQTSPEVDLDQLRQSHDLIGHLLRTLEQVKCDASRHAELSQQVQPLWDKARSQLSVLEINPESPEQMQRWLEQAEGLLLSQLTESRS